VVLLQVARRLRVPYPAMLALAGGCVAALPFAPHLSIEPRLALVLFVAPAVMDTAFDMPPREMLRIWLPLTSLAVVLVLLTTAAVAWVGSAIGGLPVAAAVALGAIVAPPDAAAAAAVLREFNLPRRTMAVLQGESLLNDAVALLAFGLAVSAAVSPGGAWSALLPRLLIAVPGGALLGALVGVATTHLAQKVAGTPSFIIVQFLLTFGTWILAEHLSLSPIVAVAGQAAVVARYMPERTSARDRVNSYAVWSVVVFVLNVLAFLLMGLQARLILNQLPADALRHALVFAAIVLAVVIGVRFLWVMAYGWVLRSLRTFFEQRIFRPPLPPARIGLLVSWCGMRGLVTLATAFALPPQFPGRNVIVLSAFTVVLGTLIVQGFTIRPLIALLRICACWPSPPSGACWRNGVTRAASSTMPIICSRMSSTAPSCTPHRSGRRRSRAESSVLQRAGRELSFLYDLRIEARRPGKRASNSAARTRLDRSTPRRTLTISPASRSMR
jgi:NhaP-type Na+/H+ or K+/H+ antiporter